MYSTVRRISSNVLRAPLGSRLRSLASHPLNQYKAQNEPLLDYKPGSPERQELEDAIKKYEGAVAEIPIVIGDEEVFTDDVRYQVAPFDHQRKIAKFHYASSGLIRRAINVSQEVRHAWDQRPLVERAEIFLRAADLIAGKYRMDVMASTMIGQGKTIVQADIDAAAELIDFLKFNVQYAFDMTQYQPISAGASKNSMIYRGMEGFWAAVSPFNFTAIGGNLASAPALMGNVVMWKPSDTAMLSNYTVFKIFQEAGVPAGVINFLPSDGPVFGDAITSSPDLSGINFTGSTATFRHLWQEVGKNIATYNSWPRLIGETGGKNFHFVHSSADVESVVLGTVRSGFEYGGQKCSACSRVYVPRSLWPKVKEGLIETTKQVKLGSPLEGDTFLSAVIDDKSFGRIKGHLEFAKQDPNIDILIGGECDDSVGYYVQPTILECKNPDNKLMKEEIFGPVVSVYVYEDKDYKDILKLLDSSTAYGLTGAVYAEDRSVVDEAMDVLRQSTGNFYINDKSTGSVVGQQPFGGARASGTNDKAGAPFYLMRFCNPQSIKETSAPMREWKYPSMQ